MAMDSDFMLLTYKLICKHTTLLLCTFLQIQKFIAKLVWQQLGCEYETGVDHVLTNKCQLDLNYLLKYSLDKAKKENQSFLDKMESQSINKRFHLRRMIYYLSLKKRMHSQCYVTASLTLLATGS